ncbi:hypothetical protein D3C76_1573190 [compost metagenome]
MSNDDTLMVYSKSGSRSLIRVTGTIYLSPQCSSLSRILTPVAPLGSSHVKSNDLAVSAVMLTSGADGGGPGGVPVVSNVVFLLFSDKFPSLSLARTDT